MADWDRSTPWRQGRVIAADALAALGLSPVEHNEARPIGVVISHDCDLAQDPANEPSVEIIVGRIVANADGNFTHAKNSRRLHLPCTAGSRVAVIELGASAKQVITKSGNGGIGAHHPAANLLFNATELNILQRWLAARYRRAAFPDEFDRRIRHESGVWDALLKILKPSGNHISALFVDLDEGRQRERHGADDCYTLALYLMYDSDGDPAAAEMAAQKAAGQIEALFEKKLRVNGAWRWIELVECLPISDQALTYAQSQVFRKWNLDYLSLHSDPAGPIAD